MTRFVANARPLEQVDNDSYYFRGYAHWGVHETMLTDTVRTGGYERAICDNAAFFKDKVCVRVCMCVLCAVGDSHMSSSK